MYKQPLKNPHQQHFLRQHKPSMSRFMALLKRKLKLKYHCLLCDESSPLRICHHCQGFLIKPKHSCQQCAQPLEHFALFCGQCLKQAPSYNKVYSPFLYQTPLSTLILDYKERGHEYAGKGLSDIFCESVFRHYQHQHMLLPALITPVPLHWRNQWTRGFNQSAFFSRALSKYLNIKHVECSRRIKWTKPQKALSQNERVKSLRNSFLVSKPLNGESIVIVDDVMTTGATVNTLAKELKRAGAGEVSVWVLARTPNYR
jgi:ComF family protein